MKRWRLAVFVSVAMGSTACQTSSAPETEAVQQALGGDPCTAQLPNPVPVWTGDHPPLTGLTEIYILATPANGYSLAVLVDYQAAVIKYARQVPVGKRNSFISMTQDNYGRLVVGGNPPPPPDVIDPSMLGPYLVFAAIRYANVPYEAKGDAMSCPVLNPIVCNPLKGC